MAALSQHFESLKARLDKVLHEKNKLNDVLEKIEQKTGIRRLYIALGFIAVLALYLMIGYGADFLCNLIGFLYPAYASVKAIESHNKDDDTKWLTYWVVYSVFSLVEFFSDQFLFWIPLYWFLKCVFLAWCFLPVSWNGSHLIYHRFIRPFILRHQGRIDSTLDEAGAAINEARGMAEELAADEFVRRATSSIKSD
jgi:receptor expression-enhancing protein 5/6